ncbi:hypothetical protein AAX06_06265 [Moraxella bovoculi]|uniref:Uncharacterized protein n=1 Tax=Moraxella bovoculi TaxID=386891 RepID=A0AAC8PVL6_9GAMM|nr:hypothetical protein [Moraxella bovoculi]AKG07825.1 hypothetical protein AAX06_06265 [Moraxella bovoculi]AKG11455.1 hypothetical protein AAX07_05015 [Moraxella bovoculi]AKG13462.1 hypothetical protein AAX11_04785 [Moraxella bovoculi]
MIIIENMQELVQAIQKWHVCNLWAISQLKEQTHDGAAIAAYEDCLNIFSELPLDILVTIKKEFEDTLFEDE